jgi:glycosyltransferase involved in cell wall biosynthesis
MSDEGLGRRLSDHVAIRLLVVTREQGSDKRYGLGKSLAPILEQLVNQGIEYRYLSQADLSPRNKRILTVVSRAFASMIRLLPWLEVRNCLNILLVGVIERLNMGRLATKLAKTNSFTHIHCHDPIIAAGLFLFSFRKRPLVVVTQHGFGSYAQAIHEDGVPMPASIMRVMRRWERRILRRCHRVITPTKLGRLQLARDLCEYPLPTHWSVIPHPSPSLNLSPQYEARSELGLEQDTFYILAVGRIVPLKDFDTLIEACIEINPVKKWKLVILGDGDRETLLQTAFDRGLQKDSLIITATDDIGLWYSAANIYISTSLTESFGMANHEAVCSGLPSILTAVAAVPEVSGNSSYLIPASNSQALTNAIEDLMRDEKLRNRLAQRGRQLGESWPTAREIADQYLTCYQPHRASRS